jgi:hypothetical protein
VVAGAAMGIFFAAITNLAIKKSISEGSFERSEKFTTRYELRQSQINPHELNAKSTNGNNS